MSALSKIMKVTQAVYSTITHIEDVFSTYLYTGTGATKTITNGIDLAGKGGMVWIKSRDASYAHARVDTARGTGQTLTQGTTANQSTAVGLTTFNSTGFTLGADTDLLLSNDVTGGKRVSWTFRKAANFFDVVTWTGTGSNRTIAHNLGSVPGMILVKRTDTTGNWMVYHSAFANTDYAVFNNTAATVTDATVWNSATATSAVFSLGTHINVNENAGTYVAYVFGHDTSATGLIQCGSFTADGTGSPQKITLGFEPQFLLMKDASAVDAWQVGDIAREFPAHDSMGANAALTVNANSTAAENTATRNISVVTDGFYATYSAGFGGNTVIYMAIPRGPTKQPTSGTQVYAAAARSGSSGPDSITGIGFPPDLLISGGRTSNFSSFWDRLRGISNMLRASTTGAETTVSDSQTAWTMDGALVGADVNSYINASGSTYIDWCFRRYPGVFDTVCYTGTGASHTVTHALGVVPEIVLIKSRGAARNWQFNLNFGSSTYDQLILNGTNAVTSAVSYASGAIQSAQPTTTTFSVGTAATANTNNEDYVAYLFASLSGISKISSYTGNGSSQTINCGFAAGARFLMIKRTDTTGDWFVWDSTRGIVAGNDPHLSLNTTSADVTTDDSIDPDSSGFIVNQLVATNVNVTSATYIYLAIA